MKKYIVSVPEVWYQDYEIEADSPEDALKIIMEGNGDPLTVDGFEYSHTIDNAGQFKVKEAS